MYESLRAFATRIECAVSYAHKLKKTGRLVMVNVDGKEQVDVEASLKLMKKTVHVSKQYMQQVNVDQRKKHRGVAAPLHTETDDDDDQPPDDAPMQGASETVAERFNKARAEREHFESKIRELKFLEMQGELVRAVDVEALWAKRITALRERLLQVPARLAPMVISANDLPTASQVIEAEIHDLMKAISHGRA